MLNAANNVIFFVVPSGILSTVYGSNAVYSVAGPSADGALATSTKLGTSGQGGGNPGPAGLALAPNSDLFIADPSNHAIRIVRPTLCLTPSPPSLIV